MKNNSGLNLYLGTGAQDADKLETMSDAGPKLHLAAGGGKPDSPRSAGSAAALGEALTGRLSHMRLRILISYWYYKDTGLDDLLARYFDPRPEIFADSGAFSAYNKNVVLRVEDYADWLLKWQHLFTVYANLDDKASWLKSLENLRYLESRGLHPIPVWHAGEPWDYLADLIAAYPYIAIGGVAGAGKGEDVQGRVFVKAFRMARGRAVFHGFGMTRWNLLKAFPWYSVDSSSWGQGFRFGIVPLFNPRAGGFLKLKLGNRQDWYGAASLVRALGFDPEDFADRKRNDRAKICGLSAISYMLAEQWLRLRHGEITIPAREPGLKLYLADTNATNLGDAGKGLKLYLADATANLKDTANASRGLQQVGER